MTFDYHLKKYGEIRAAIGQPGQWLLTTT